MEQTEVIPNLSTIANVAKSYVHRDKLIETKTRIALSGGWLKWYDLAAGETPVPHDIRDLARGFLERESANGSLNVPGDLGFVILHRCGRDFYFLLVNTWRNENELWESVYAKESDGQVDFRLFQLQGSHKGTFCVWELAAVWHEQQAWRRYLLSRRDDAAKSTYLQDCYEGSA